LQKTYRWYNYALDKIIGSPSDTTGSFKTMVGSNAWNKTYYAAIVIKNNECIDTTNKVEIRLKTLFGEDATSNLAIRGEYTNYAYLSSSWADFDKDGDDDVLLLGSDRVKLYRNDGNSKFTEPYRLFLRIPLKDSNLLIGAIITMMVLQIFI
jgi:FG-GAP-like repeat